MGQNSIFKIAITQYLKALKGRITIGAKEWVLAFLRMLTFQFYRKIRIDPGFSIILVYNWSSFATDFDGSNGH